MQIEHVRSDFDLRTILRVIWRRKLSIVLSMAILVGGQLLLTSRQAPVYSSCSQILVTPETNLFNTNSSVADPTRALQNESAIITSVTIRDLVRQQTGKRLSVSATPSDKSDTVKLCASGSSAQKVTDTVNEYTAAYTKIRERLIEASQGQSRGQLDKAIADLQARLARLDAAETTIKDEITAASGDPSRQNSLATQLLQLQDTNSSQRTNINNQLGKLQDQRNLVSIVDVVNSAQSTRNNITVLTYANVPKSPTSPKPMRDAMVAALAGLLIGTTIAYAREQTEDHVRGRLDLEADFPDYPVLAAVPRFDGIGPNEIITERRRTSPAAEGYRKLRTSLEFLSLTQRLGVVELTSPAAGEGKTTTAVNLAVAVAQSGQRVIIVCADFRIPKAHLYFDLPNDIGMTSVLLDRATLAEAVKPTRVPGLYMLPAGPVPSNPSELLDSERAHELIDALAARFDLVIIDTPPILPVADPLVTATMADATIVVVRSRKSRRRQLRRAMETLAQLEIPLAGLVLNDETADEAHAFGYGYGYYGKSYGHREVSNAVRAEEAAKAPDDPYPTLLADPPVTGGSTPTPPPEVNGNGSGNGTGHAFPAPTFDAPPPPSFGEIPTGPERPADPS